MARYKDIDAIIEQMNGSTAETWGKGLGRSWWSHSVMLKDNIVQLMKDAPEADVVEVRHGHNATSMHPVDEFVCSVCGFICNDYTEAVYDEDGDYTYYRECEFKYCPNCGAKMDGDAE